MSKAYGAGLCESDKPTHIVNIGFNYGGSLSGVDKDLKNFPTINKALYGSEASSNTVSDSSFQTAQNHKASLLNSLKSLSAKIGDSKKLL